MKIQYEKIRPDVEDGLRASGRIEILPGEEVIFGLRFYHGSEGPGVGFYYKIWALAGDPDPDGRCRFPIEPIPINGEDPLIIREEDCAGSGSA